MPTYEYACTKCGHTFEAIQRMTEKPLSRCPKCRHAVRRVINGGMGVIFKGSGFYTTDNKKGSSLAPGNGGSKEGDKASQSAGSGSNGSSSSEKASTEKTTSEKTTSEKTPSSKAAAS
jgi:putative FmdB family regulatory protein